MWLYNDKEVRTHADIHPDTTDFVYLITYTDGRRYIGKKTIKSIRKKPPLKGKKRARRILTKHPFEKYEGSLTGEFGVTIAEKRILYLCATKKAATYLETMLLFHEGAIFSDEYLNRNISGTFYDNDLHGLIEEADDIF